MEANNTENHEEITLIQITYIVWPYIKNFLTRCLVWSSKHDVMYRGQSIPQCSILEFPVNTFVHITETAAKILLGWLIVWAQQIIVRIYIFLIPTLDIYLHAYKTLQT